MTNIAHSNIAMWSGPRNISTAMMYSFGNRADCVAWDEPFYGAYLKTSGLVHPMRDEIIRACKTDWQDIEDVCHQLGGKFPSIYETVEEICKGGVASKLSLLSFGNEVFSVTCENYQETLPEIGLGLAGTLNEEL